MVNPKPKDFVLAKMQSYPAWPSYVMPVNDIPKDVLKAKPKNGKNICVLFIPDADFIWVGPNDIVKLTDELLEKKVKEAKKNKKLLKLQKALIASKDMTYDSLILRLKGEKVDDNEAEAEEEEDDDGDDVQEEDVADNEEEDLEPGIDHQEDILDIPEVEDKKIDKKVDKKGGGKKIDDKHDAYNNGNKNEASTNGTSTNGTSTNGVSKNGGSKNGKSITRSNDNPTDDVDKKSDDEVTRKRKPNDVAGSSKRHKTVSPGPVTTSTSTSSNGKLQNKSSKLSGEHSPPIAHKKHESLTEEEKLEQLWLCRIKLQKSLIQRPNNTGASVDELSISRLILHKLVDFPMDLKLLKTTKIHKVLRHILKEQKYEMNESFRLHEKCHELLNKWSDLIDSIRLEKNSESDVSEVKDKPINDKPINDVSAEPVETN